MDKLLGFVCALLCAWNADAQITAWTGKSITGTITGTGTADFSATLKPVISASSAVGATLFTVTATATGTDTIASYAFKATTGNADSLGTITKDGTMGVVTLAKTVNYPTVKEAKFEIIAVDSKGTPNTGTATVTVTFGPSKYSSYSFCVADPTATGGTIGSLSSSVTTATWAISGTDAAKFTLASGKITAASKLETHDKTSYAAIVTLTDGSTSSAYPLNVIVGNTCAATSGVAQIVSSVAMVVLTVLGIHVM